jgi:hypothetical protein
MRFVLLLELFVSRFRMGSEPYLALRPVFWGRILGVSLQIVEFISR